MLCSSTLHIGLALTLLGPEPRGVDQPSPEPEGDVVTTMMEKEELATRGEQMYERAVEFAEKGQFHDASEYIVRAYVELEDEARFGDPGLLLLREAVVYHLKAYRQAEDDALLASIQPLVERFFEHYQGVDPKKEELRRDLQTIRDLRLSASERYLEEGKFTKAAIEARACYRELQAADKARAIGEAAALAASRAYREAWYLDGDIRYIESAIEVVDDHLAKAGELASVPAKRERKRLEGDLRRARTSMRSRSEEATSPRDRAFRLAIGAGLGGGLALSAGAAAVGAYTFVQPSGSPGAIDARPGATATGIGLGLAGGAVAALASHVLADAGLVSSRRRVFLAAGTTAIGLVGIVLGSALMGVGSLQKGTEARDLRLQNAGFGVLLGMGAPLGVGIATIVTRWADR